MRNTDHDDLNNIFISPRVTTENAKHRDIFKPHCKNLGKENRSTCRPVKDLRNSAPEKGLVALFTMRQLNE